MLSAGGTHPTPLQVLASNLWRLRTAKGLSISELARMTKISKATLSSIEARRANPTVEKLTVLATALGVSVAELLEHKPPREVRVVRADADAHDWRRQRGVRRRSLGASRGLTQIEEIALADDEGDELEPLATGSQAHVFVLEGKLIAGPLARPAELHAGDYGSFPADVVHVLAATRGPAHALLLLTSSAG